MEYFNTLLPSFALRITDKVEDPAADKVASRRVHGDSFDMVAKEFIDRYAKKKQVRTWPKTERIFTQHVNPDWGTRTMAT